MSRGSTSLEGTIEQGVSDSPAWAQGCAAPGGQGGKAPLKGDDSLT